jgi:hypothetical protein
VTRDHCFKPLHLCVGAMSVKPVVLLLDHMTDGLNMERAGLVIRFQNGLTNFCF